MKEFNIKAHKELKEDKEIRCIKIFKELLIKKNSAIKKEREWKEEVEKVQEEILKAEQMSIDELINKYKYILTGACVSDSSSELLTGGSG